MRKVVLGSLLVLGALGVRSAHADPPAWCSTPGLEKDRYRDVDVKEALGDQAMDAVHAIVGLTCFPNDEAKQRAKEVAKAREAWSKKLDLTDKEWGEVGVWGSGQPSSYQDTSDLTNEFGKKYAWSELDPVEQFAGIQNGFPNNGAGNGYSEYGYLTDALGPKLSEAGRLAWILHCSGSGTGAVSSAMCQPDIARLDRKKLAAELRASKATPEYKTKIRFIIYALNDRLAAHATEVKALQAKDPAYKKMFDIAETTRKEWDDLWAKQAALVDLALQMDDARQTSSRKAFEGCEDKVWPAWEAEVAKIPAKRFEGFSTKIEDSWTEPGMGVVLSTPGGYLASTALFTCLTHGASASSKDAIISTLGEVLGAYPGNRGPRQATHLAILNAGLQLDDQSASIDYPGTDFRQKFNGQSARGDFGTVAKVEAGGKGKGAKPKAGADKAVEMVTVTFNKKFEKQEQCANSRRTNRISYIRSDGGISYELDCLKWEIVSIDRTPDPEVVTARSAKGLKPGMNAYIGEDEVIAAWPKGAKAPSIVAGVAVK